VEGLAAGDALCTPSDAFVMNDARYAFDADHCISISELTSTPTLIDGNACFYPSAPPR